MAKAKKAKNAGNQAALERLHELKEKSAHNTNYVHAINRAIKSLAACPHVIATRGEACALKYVGPHVAKVICPHEQAVVPAPRQVSRGSSVGSNDNDSNSAGKADAAAASKPGKRRAARPLPTSVVPEAGGRDGKVASLSAKQIAYDKAVQEAADLKLSSGPWKVVLIVDGRERQAEHVQAKIQMSGIPCEQRHLPIGDMAWMATSGDTEIMLGTIVERKDVQDLASSLFGTRYQEQRLRLQHCGLPQVLLLVEGNTSAVRNCPGDTLQTCMMETRVQLDFQVVTTRHLEDTIRFLKNVHRRILQRSFPSAFGDALPTSLPSFASPNSSANRFRRRKKKVSLVDIVFDSPPVAPLGMERFVTYAELKAKVARDREAGTRTVGAIHAAMLKQIPTLSLKKVQAIQQAYPTPQALYMTFEGLDPCDGKTLVQDFTTSHEAERTCRVGPKSAAEVYHTYTEVATATQGEETDSSSTKIAAMSRQESVAWTSAEDNNNVARIPSPSAFGDSSSSPLWSPESDANVPLPAWSPSSPPRKPAASSLKGSPTSPIDEMQLALHRRRMQYQESQKKSVAIETSVPPPDNDDFVDLTQGNESDTEDNVDCWSSQPHISQGGDVEVNPQQARSLDFAANSNTSPPDVPSSSQGSSSVDDEEEPLYIRVQRLHQAREAVQCGKRRAEMSNESMGNASKKPALEGTETEVIEIE